MIRRCARLMRAIVDQAAALTEAAQVAQAVVGRVAIQVRGSEHDARLGNFERIFAENRAATHIFCCWCVLALGRAVKYQPATGA
ncbi:MAG: hypothetical protein ACM30D_06220 [Hyphomicrobiales bacterium]